MGRVRAAGSNSDVCGVGCCRPDQLAVRVWGVSVPLGLILMFVVLGVVRELGGIPILVRLLDHEAEEVHRSAASCLRNLSYSKERDENKVGG